VSSPEAPGHPSPWPRSAREREALIGDVRALIGSSIAEVRYLQPRGSSVVDTGGCEEFDQTSVCVEFVTTAGATFSAVWRMAGDLQGLSFGPGTAESRHGMYPLQSVDLSASPHWRPLLRKPVTDVTPSWHISNTGCPEAIWAVWITVDRPPGVLVALGQATASCSIEYQPDEIVIVFDEALARTHESSAQATYDT